MKYVFHEYRRGNRPLPTDINRPVEDSIDKLFKCEELLKEIVECREKLRFCEVEFSRGGIACNIQFVRGIIPRYFLIGRTKTKEGEYIIHKRTVNNDNLLFPKNQLKNEKED